MSILLLAFKVIDLKQIFYFLLSYALHFRANLNGHMAIIDGPPVPLSKILRTSLTLAHGAASHN
jgi:hypothetical protein